MSGSIDERRLKQATRRLIAAAGGVDGAGETVGKASSTASRWQCAHESAFMPINDVATLEEVAHREAGWPHVTRELARRAGFLLVALPPAGAGATELHRSVASVAKETGEVVAGICSALANDDGVVLRREAVAGQREEVREAMTALAQLDALLAAIGEG